MRTNLGFTLIEVLIAVAIIAGGIVIVTMTWSGNLLRVRKSNLYHNVGYLLERKMVEMESKYRNTPLEEIPETLKGDFGEDYPRYTWTFETQEFEMPDLTPVLIGREGGADEMLISIIRQTQDFISKSVKEATVSVIVKVPKRKEGKNPKFSVTTYFVNYDQELDIAAAASGGSGGE
jgi:prepilin-type N-terminal cleavage/methylation domain-containing protein